MDKSELLRALQTEIQKDNLSTFMHEEQEGRPNRVFLLRKDFGTVGQFKISPHRRRSSAAARQPGVRQI